MRKVSGILTLIFLFLVGGYIVSGTIIFGGGDRYYGHLGYCNTIELPHFNLISNLSSTICLFILIYSIYLETFLKFEKHRKCYPYLLIFLLTFLGYLTYNCVQFPFLDRSYSFMGQSDKQEGIINPLMNINLFYSVILLWFIIRFQLKTHALKLLSILSYLYISIVLITILFIYQIAEYEFCHG